MKKAAAKQTTTSEGDALRKLAMNSAKRQFVGTTLDMSWRLAITVLIPLVGGVKLDQRLNSAPSWTITGLMLAAFGASMVVWNAVNEINQTQAEESKKEKKTK
jgi:F0F1-type ATP synthase assembly protein I